MHKGINSALVKTQKMKYNVLILLRSELWGFSLVSELTCRTRKIERLAWSYEKGCRRLGSWRHFHVLRAYLPWLGCLVIFWNKNYPNHPCNASSIHHFRNRKNLWQVSSHSRTKIITTNLVPSIVMTPKVTESQASVKLCNKSSASFQVWDVRSDQVVRSIHGPYICGDGIDIWEDSILTASWVARDALQVRFIRKYELMLSYKHFCSLFFSC